jgi:VanZ family protein
MRIPNAVRWLLVALWMGLIFYMSSRSDSGEQSGALIRMIFDALHVAPAPDRLEFWHHILRKAAHFTEYAILASLIAFARARTSWRGLAVAWAAATLYACTDEFHQVFVPTRGPSVWDVGIDSTGAAAAVVAIWACWRER